MTFEQLLALVRSQQAPRLCIDSRLVKPGDIFIAIKGTVYDGGDFIEQAIAAGAKYILCQHPCHCKDAEVVTVEDPAKAAAMLAQAAEDNPAAQLTNLAVTGTNGKTTVAFLVRSVIRTAGKKCGLIGTIIYDTTLTDSPAFLTTPDCLTIAQTQSQMLQAGAEYMVIEASSHALSQNRLAAINFKAAAFTNLAADHLDYHKTKQGYLAAKTKLFEALSPDAVAVLNRQSPEAEQIPPKTKAEILWYAVDTAADLSAHIESMDINKTVFVLEYAGQKHKVVTPLLGRHNVSNHLAAAGLCLAAGFDLETIAAGLSALQSVPGRLEKIEADDIHIFIDYAHTEDAIENVLSTLKPLCQAKLALVFGCGGDRYRTKRPRMAKVAEQLADSVIVTNDNPRTEPPDVIINDIVTGFENPDSPKICIEPDRKKAIELAVKTAGTDDIILIAGKGHETYQIIATQKLPFSDADVVRESLKKRK